jgi:peptidoglycan/xylan/chitin deacetylase (PgdA/CDA1 family)
VLSAIGYAGLRATGLPALTRRFGRGGVILCYHNVVRARYTQDAGDPGLHLPLDRFTEQIRWLARHYTIIPLEEMVVRIRTGRPLHGQVALTFDDGYRGVFDSALPVLRDLRLPATVFVVATAPGASTPFWWDHPAIVRREPLSDPSHWLHDLRGDPAAILGTLDSAAPERVPRSHLPDGWASIVAATTQGISIGAHTLLHRNLTRLTDEELEADLVECRTLIQWQTGIRPTILAYPYGLWDRRVRDAVRRLGFSAAVTLDRGTNTSRTDPWALRRTNVPASIGNAAFECWVAGLHR